jgi:hypothetical protein
MRTTNEPTSRLDNSIVVFPNRRAKGREPRTLGDIVALADRIPANRVTPALREHMRVLDQLLERKDNGPATARELIIVGALVYRALFQNLGLPIDRNYLVEDRDIPT